MAASLVPPLAGAELVPDVFQAVGGDRPLELAGVVKRGHGGRRDGQPRSAAGAERVLNAPLGRAAFFEILDRLFDHRARNQETRVVRRAQGLHLGDRHRAFVAGAGSVGPPPCPALPLAGQGHRLANRHLHLLAQRLLGDHAVDRRQEHEGEAVPVHRDASLLRRAGDQPRGRGAAHQELDGALNVLGVLAARGRVSVGEDRRARQAGHGHRVILAPAGDPRAVLGLHGSQGIEPLENGADRLGRDVLGQDLLVHRPGAIEPASQPAPTTDAAPIEPARQCFRKPRRVVRRWRPVAVKS